MNNTRQHVVAKWQDALRARKPEQTLIYAGENNFAVLNASEDALAWIKEISPSAKVVDCPVGFVVMFKKASDATLFKLAWGGA